MYHLIIWINSNWQIKRNYRTQYPELIPQKLNLWIIIKYSNFRRCSKKRIRGGYAKNHLKFVGGKWLFDSKSWVDHEGEERTGGESQGVGRESHYMGWE